MIKNGQAKICKENKNDMLGMMIPLLNNNRQVQLPHTAIVIGV